MQHLPELPSRSVLEPRGEFAEDERQLRNPKVGAKVGYQFFQFRKIRLRLRDVGFALMPDYSLQAAVLQRLTRPGESLFIVSVRRALEPRVYGAAAAGVDHESYAPACPLRHALSK